MTTQPFLASADGCSLHAGDPTGRLSLTAQGQVRYTLQTPYRDGTTHVVVEPLDGMARLAALVPINFSLTQPTHQGITRPVHS